MEQYPKKLWILLIPSNSPFPHANYKLVLKCLFSMSFFRWKRQLQRRLWRSNLHVVQWKSNKCILRQKVRQAKNEWSPTCLTFFYRILAKTAPKSGLWTCSILLELRRLRSILGLPDWCCESRPRLCYFQPGWNLYSHH